ncbi:MAG: flagellar hook protein FlgE [Salinibacter sp.]
MSLQSLRTGVSGLLANQTRLDVISNNISNSSTVAFKEGRAAFSEVLGQEILGRSSTKVGRGVSVASVDRNFSQGSLDQTGIKTDLALNGDGFFIASPEKGAGSQQRRLTRAGDFTFNQNGELVTNGGLNVKGWTVNDQGKAQTGQLKNIQLDPNAQSSAKFSSKATIGGNLAAEATDGTKTSISTVVYDEQGTAHDVVVEFTKDVDNGTPNNPSDDNPDRWDFTIKSADGEAFQDGGNPSNDVRAEGTITFNTDGSVDQISTTEGSTYSAQPPGGSAEGVKLTWKNNLVSGGKGMKLSMQNITQYSGSTTAKFQSQNGHTSGELAGFSFTKEGKLQLNYTNGEQEQTYQLAIGNVNNPNGLEQQGDNFYTTTSASGDLQLGRAGRDLQTSVVSGSLESSNVDLAQEFADLIQAQRSYQASARVVTTADQVLQETVQLKR